MRQSHSSTRAGNGKDILTITVGMLARYKWGDSKWQYIMIIKKLPSEQVVVFYSGKIKKVYIDGIEKMKQLESWEFIQCL